MQRASVSTATAVPHDPPDWTAVERLRRGDLSALDVLYARHASALLRLALHLTGSRSDAEDVVHDVFVSLPVALRRYEERGQLGAWLRTLVARRAVDRARGRKRRREVPIAAAAQAPSPTSAEPPARADAAGLMAPVAALPNALRTVFVLRAVEGLPYTEIASALDVRVGTAQVRYFRAVRALRRSLEDLSC